MNPTKGAQALLVFLVVGLWSSAAVAHKFAPSLLKLTELPSSVAGAQRFHVLWKTPARITSKVLLKPQWPEACDSSLQSPSRAEGSAVVFTWHLNCEFGDGNLAGHAIGVSGLADNQASAMVIVELLNGLTYQQLLSAEMSIFEIPEASAGASVFGDYIGLGVEHIWSGLDHLLFIFGLLLLVPARVRLIATITAFTLGHSITLSLVALGLFSYPVALVELLIALSIFLLALELARFDGGGRWWRDPWYLAGSFGLLHGMGFAGALLETGLPQDNILSALLAFNLGIELGQLIFVALAVAIGCVAARSLQSSVKQLRSVFVYSLGGLSAMWCMQRAIEWAY